MPILKNIYKFIVMGKINIPIEIKNLDKILDKCKERMGDHYTVGEWLQLSKEIAGSDLNNYGFQAYIDSLKEQGLIIDAKTNEGEGSRDGCIVTIKGLLHKGFENELIQEKKDKRSRNRLDFIKTISGVLIGGLITALTTRYLQKSHSTTVINQVPIQKVQISYDTILVAIPKNHQDTSLVRLVKQTELTKTKTSENK